MSAGVRRNDNQAASLRRPHRPVPAHRRARIRRPREPGKTTARTLRNRNWPSFRRDRPSETPPGRPALAPSTHDSAVATWFLLVPGFYAPFGRAGVAKNALHRRLLQVSKEPCHSEGGRYNAWAESRKV